MIGWRLLWRHAPDPGDVAALVSEAGEADAELARQLETWDAGLRRAERGAVQALAAAFANALVSPGTRERYAYALGRLWSLAAMPIAPGDPVGRHPLPWLASLSPLDPARRIVQVRSPGILFGAGLVLRPADVELDGDAAGDTCEVPAPADGAREVAARLAGAALASELRALLVRRAAGPLELKHALELIDGLLAWASGERQHGRELPEELAAGIEVLARDAARTAEAAGLELFPVGERNGTPLDELRARWGREAIQFRGRWCPGVDPGGLLWVERLGLRGEPAAERPARVWVSRGAPPPELAAASAAVELLREAGDEALATRAPRWLDELALADPEPRVRALCGLVNALDQLESPELRARGAELAPALTELLEEAGVHEVPIRPGDPFDLYPPDLYHVRRSQRTGARPGEIVAVSRRAFRWADGRLVQQATIEVNLGE